jgi:hypothetical protein
MRPTALTIAKTVAKVSVVTDTAVGKKERRTPIHKSYSSQSSSVRNVWHAAGADAVSDGVAFFPGPVTTEWVAWPEIRD